MAISMVIGFFNLINSIFGVCFVIRNKIDVPNSLPRRSSRGSSISSNSSEQGKERKKGKRSSKKLNKSGSLSLLSKDSLADNHSDGEVDHDQSGSEAISGTTYKNYSNSAS
jgi:hypothetical protein